MAIIAPVNFKIGNYLTEYMPETAPLGKLAKEAKEVVDEAHQYVSNSMFAAKKGAKEVDADNSVGELVGNIINFFG